MLQNLNDVYELIKSSAYVAKWKPVMPTTKRKDTYILYNQYTPLSNRVVIATNGQTAEIHVTNYMNSLYYEHFRLTNKRDAHRFARISDIVFMKNMVAMVQHVNSL